MVGSIMSSGRCEDHGPGWHAHGDMAPRKVLHQDRIGTHLGPVLDDDRPQDLGTGADLHIVADGGMTLAGTHRHPAQSHPVEQQDVVADLGGLTDDHAPCRGR